MRRKSGVLKSLEGTARADRVRRPAPKPAVGMPQPRRGLSTSARAWFRRLSALLRDMGVLTVADGPALELLAESLAEYGAARRMLARHGSTYESTTASGAKIWRPRAEQRVASDAWTRSVALMKRFGLTPLDRARLEVEPPEPLHLLKSGTDDGPDRARFFRDR